MALHQLGALRSDDETFFFGLHLYMAGRSRENLQSAKGPAQRKSGPGNNMIGRRNHLLYHFKITIHLHFAIFYATKYF